VAAIRDGRIFSADMFPANNTWDPRKIGGRSGIPYLHLAPRNANRLKKNWRFALRARRSKVVFTAHIEPFKSTLQMEGVPANQRDVIMCDGK